MKMTPELRNAITEMAKTSLPQKLYIRVNGMNYKAAVNKHTVRLVSNTESQTINLSDQTCTCTLPEDAIILRTPAGVGHEHFADQVKAILNSKGRKATVIGVGPHARAEISKARMVGAQIILCADTKQHGAVPGTSVADLIGRGKCSHLKALNKYALKAYRIERELLPCKH